MSDKITEFPEKKTVKEPCSSQEKGKGPLGRILYSILLIAIVLSVVSLVLFSDRLNLDRIRRALSYASVSTNELGQAEAISFDPHSTNRYEAFKGGVAVASAAGLRVFSDGGSEIIDQPMLMTNPAVLSSDSSVMAYDIGGTELRVADKHGIKLRLTTELPIIDASINSAGSLAVTAGKSGYKASVKVYDASMTEIFNRNSSSKYISNAAVSKDTTSLACVGIGLEGKRFESTLEFFDLKADGGEAIGSYKLYDSNVLDVFYVDNKILCAVCDDSLVFVDTSGELKGEYVFFDEHLWDYSLCDDGSVLLALSRSDTGRGATLLRIDSDGSETFRVKQQETPICLSGSGKYVGVLTADELIIYSKEAEEYARLEDVFNGKKLKLRKDGSALVFNNNSAFLFIP